MHQNTDWEKDFDELWEHYNLSRAEVDREIVSDFIRSLLQARDEWLKGEIEKMRLLEVAVNPEGLMWKQRINGYLDRVLSLINKK